MGKASRVLKHTVFLLLTPIFFCNFQLEFIFFILHTQMFERDSQVRSLPFHSFIHTPTPSLLIWQVGPQMQIGL